MKLKEAVKEWVEKIGKHEAISRLVLRRMSVSTADKLVRDKYDNEPRGLTLAVLLEEMRKDGIAVEGEAS